jgi:hypothetical protein
MGMFTERSMEAPFDRASPHGERPIELPLSRALDEARRSDLGNGCQLSLDNNSPRRSGGRESFDEKA